MLDVRTLTAMLAAISVLLLLLGVFGIERQLRTPGLNAWAWGLAVNCAGMLLLASRGKIPYALYLLGPVLTNFIPLLQKRALDHALGQPRPMGGWVAVASLASAVTVAGILWNLSADERGVLFGVYFVAVYGVLAWQSWTAYRQHRIRPLLWLLVCFASYMLVFAYRVGVAAQGGIGSADSISSTPLNRITYLGVLFVLLAGSVSFLMLEMALLQRKLSLAAMQDQLTGLLNRRGFEPQVETAHHLHRRGGRTYSIVVFDIDHFKQVNDRHGHGGGDKVLRHVAQVLRAGLRASDSLARFGGEEFVALLPDTPLAKAACTADRLRAAVQARAVKLSDAAEVSVSVSAGVAQADGEHWTALFDRADAALYEAKAAGRNRVVTFKREAVPSPDGTTQVQDAGAM